VKRRDLLRHLKQHGCSLLREGGNHSWWHHPQQNRRSAIPRHNEIKELLVRKICPVSPVHDQHNPINICNPGLVPLSMC